MMILQMGNYRFPAEVLLVYALFCNNHSLYNH